MAEIKVLSKEVSELIAAGEVIDRPASVIKELLENAIDAGANVITVEIKNGGRTYIRVTDNGKGISKEDLPVAFLRHATSKISAKADLDTIMTLGFRGEALASICAVAKVEVLTKKANEDYGTRYEIEGTVEKTCEQCGCPDGTTVVVRDIFYNVPARLKFLKKDVSEGNNVANLVTKLTLSHPEVSFKFIRDNRTEIITAGDGKIYSAVYSVYGREFSNSLIKVDYTWQDIHVYGYTVKPILSKSNRKFQNFFVNKRYVKSKACAAALEEAYRNQIMTGKFPACVLYLDIPPQTIDVNVHPTKIEVRFSDEKLMHEAVFFAVKDALLKNDKPMNMNLDTGKRHFTDKQLYEKPMEKPKQLVFDVKEVPTQSKEQSEVLPHAYDAAPLPEPPSEQQALPKVTVVENTPIDEAQKSLGEDLFLKGLEESKAEQTERPEPEKISEPKKITVEEINRYVSEMPIANDEEDNADYHFINKKSFEKKQTVIKELPKEKEVKPVVVGELFKTYIVVQAGEEMLLVDKHAAHERYIFEKIKNDANQLKIQMLLDPIIIMLAYDEFDAICENLDNVRKLGFEIEPDVAPTIAVKGLPILLENQNPTDIITELAHNFMDNKFNPQVELFDDLYHSVACKAAIKANDVSDKIELQALVNAIYNNDNIRYCPHGRPVMITLTKKDIEKQFHRIV